MNTPKIIHLPNGRFTIEVDGQRAINTAGYSQMAFFEMPSGATYVAQTQYWGDEGIWHLGTQLDGIIEADETV